MPRLPDYYAMLGLAEDADGRAIKRAYRTAARQLHPDLPVNKGSKDAQARFAQVREAYEVLSDPDRRGQYDFFRRGPSSFDPGVAWADRNNARRVDAEPDEDFELETDAGSSVASIFEDLFAVDPRR